MQVIYGIHMEINTNNEQSKYFIDKHVYINTLLINM